MAGIRQGSYIILSAVLEIMILVDKLFDKLFLQVLLAIMIFSTVFQFARIYWAKHLSILRGGVKTPLKKL